MGQVDAVVHFAAESHVDRSILGAADFVMTNVVGTQTLLDSALQHGVAAFVHVSTDEVYGSIDSGSWDELQPLEPNSPYSASKASSDLMARSYFRTHGLGVCVTRCSNNYGPYQFPEKVIPLFVTNLIDGQTVPLYGEGANSRDWLHVDDHCRGVHLVLEGGRPGEVYNIGGGTELTNRELTDKLLAACGAGWEQCCQRRGPQGTRPALLQSPSTRSRASSAIDPASTSSRVSPTPSSGTSTTVAGGSRSRCGRGSAVRAAALRIAAGRASQRPVGQLRVVEQVDQVAAVATLQHGLGTLAKLVIAEEPLPPGHLLR